jgi:uncharacterized membrane protein
MAALCSPWAWKSASRSLRALRALGALSGTAVVVWLFYVELFRLDAICLYCSIIHVVAVLLFITIALGTAAEAPSLAPTDGDRGELDIRRGGVTRRTSGL